MCSCAEETEGEVYDNNESHEKQQIKRIIIPPPPLCRLDHACIQSAVRGNTTTLSSTSSLHLLTTSKARRSTCDPHSGSAQELTANAGGPWTDLLGGGGANDQRARPRARQKSMSAFKSASSPRRRKSMSVLRSAASPRRRKSMSAFRSASSAGAGAARGQSASTRPWTA